MKVHLMSPAVDFDAEANEPEFAGDLVDDLELDYLWDAMAGDDRFLRDVARAAVLQSSDDPTRIVYRQAALSDCLRNPEVIDELYAIAVDALAPKRGVFMFAVKNHPGMELSHAIEVLTALADQLDRLRALGAAHRDAFTSVAFRDFFGRLVLELELDDDYMALLRRTLHDLTFPGGMLMSAGIGPGGQVSGQVLRLGKDENRHFFDRTPLKRPLHSFTVPDRDEAGANALSELKDRSVNDVADAAAQAADHVTAFFRILRAELGFYLGCRNLLRAMRSIGAPMCTPDPNSADATVTAGVYDPCLAIRTGSAPVGNTVEIRDGRLLVITGANLGGKSTLLRALGTAQLMMQAGMPVAADGFGARPVGRVFTHWAREEDTELAHGKLDEELDRMDRIVASIRTGDLLLCNESFASTNEAEGSQINMDLVRALVQAGVQVRTVTHLFDFAAEAADDPSLGAVFLRAPRAEGGERSYLLEPGPPLATSFGLDLFDKEFGTQHAEREVPC